MPWFFDRGFAVSVVHLLTAGDVAARVVKLSKEGHGIEVTTSDGSKIVWANADCKPWAYTHIIVTDDSLTSGQQRTFHSDVAWDSPPETVAALIATHDYGASLVAPE